MVALEHQSGSDGRGHPATPFTIKLVSRNAAGAPAPLPDFNPAATYSWTIATTASGISGFEAAQFVVDTTGFANATHGVFSVTTNGNSLVLVYTGMAQPPAFSGVQKLPDHNFRLTFTGPQGAHYSVHATANVALKPVASWPVIGTGLFSAGATTFDDLNATNSPHMFYLISTP